MSEHRSDVRMSASTSHSSRSANFKGLDTMHSSAMLKFAMLLMAISDSLQPQ